MSVAAVEFVSQDGVCLRGELRPGDSDWFVLVHDLESDLDCWSFFPSLWASELSVLAFDLRGHGGSEGRADRGDVWRDVAAALAFARSQGSAFVCVVASGQSAVGVLEAHPNDLAQAYVLVSPDPGPVGQDIANLRAPGAAKLVMFGSLDDRADSAAAALCRASIGLCTTVSFPTAEQGTSLLGSKWGTHALERVSAFVQEQRYLASEEMRRR
jgi:pimeloyl-ACP methyl ester carboxylesterase